MQFKIIYIPYSLIKVIQYLSLLGQIRMVVFVRYLQSKCQMITNNESRIDYWLKFGKKWLHNQIIIMISWCFNKSVFFFYTCMGFIHYAKTQRAELMKRVNTCTMIARNHFLYDIFILYKMTFIILNPKIDNFRKLCVSRRLLLSRLYILMRYDCVHVIHGL